MNIRDHDEIHTRFEREKFKSMADAIKKNISDVKVELYNSKTYVPHQSNINEHLVYDFNQANVIIIKKNKEPIIFIHPVGLATLYAMINIFKKQLTEHEYSIILKILKLYDIKLPRSHKLWFKWSMFIGLYGALTFFLYFLYINFFSDFLSKGTLEYELSDYFLISFIPIIIITPIIVSYVYLRYKEKKMIKIKQKKLENIQIKM